MWVTLPDTQLLESRGAGRARAWGSGGGGWSAGGRFLLVALFHVLLVALLLSASGVIPVPAPLLVTRLIFARPPLPAPPPTPTPRLTAPAFPVPVPEVRVMSPVSPRAISAPIRPAPGPRFAGGGDTGLALDIGGAATGGAGSRAGLEDFEAEVKRRILAQKRQPTLAWDRRNTCVVNYTVSVGAGGRLAGFRIDPCAVPEINAAARQAIAAAAPFPPPPALGAAAADVHGTLIFRP